MKRTKEYAKEYLPFSLLSLPLSLSLVSLFLQYFPFNCSDGGGPTTVVSLPSTPLTATPTLPRHNPSPLHQILTRTHTHTKQDSKHKRHTQSSHLIHLALPLHTTRTHTCLTYDTCTARLIDRKIETEVQSEREKGRKEDCKRRRSPPNYLLILPSHTHVHTIPAQVDR